MTPSVQSTPSEGEIVESDSEKASLSLHSNGSLVDPHSRKRVSVSQSASPVRSPSRIKSRSRSPYRESRGAKRPHEDDHYSNRVRSHNRWLNAGQGETLPTRGLKPHQDYGTATRAAPRYSTTRHSGRDAYESFGSKDRRPRSRSPYRHTSRGGDTRGERRVYQSSDHRGIVREHGESNDRLSSKQSVSNRGFPNIATGSMKQNAEANAIQTQFKDADHVSSVQDTAKGPSDQGINFQDSSQADSGQIVDEATVIEERRKKREAIKAKYKGQNASEMAQALSLDKTATSEAQSITGTEKPASSSPNDTPQRSPSPTPRDLTGNESPIDFVFLNDKYLANKNADITVKDQGDEPSAADYDPTNDMQEDQMRHDQRLQGNELPSSAYDERDTEQDVLLPSAMVEKTTQQKPKSEFDMFADEELDMFADAQEASDEKHLDGHDARGVPVQPKALDMNMLDDWDDHDGYYKIILGELLDGRYHVQSNLGKGMFSGVVRATDQTSKGLVAIKIIRNNETLKRAGQKEITILQKLAHLDPIDKKNLIRLERTFDHKGHLCMVFENLSINLREVLKKFGRDVGINLKAVRAYAQQMFMGLSLLRKANILHADLKPDNMLVDESRTKLKICDLGSASDASENEITQYLVSRFYRAPEIILGLPYDFAIDTWSIGCTLFELFTGKILFTGRNNNQMLRAIMECRGKFSHKILRKAQFAPFHFDDNLDFRSVEKDKLTGRDVVRILKLSKPTRDLKTRLIANAKGMNDVETKDLNLFADFLDRCLNLNPEKRFKPLDALKHPFIMRGKI